MKCVTKTPLSALALLLLIQGAALLAHSHGHADHGRHLSAACNLCQMISLQGPSDLETPSAPSVVCTITAPSAVVSEPTITVLAMDLRPRGPPLDLL